MQHLFSHTHVQAKKVKGATKPIKAIDPKTCKKASAKNPTPRYNAGLIYEAFSAAGCDKTELDDVSFFYSCKFFLYIVNTHTKKKQCRLMFHNRMASLWLRDAKTGEVSDASVQKPVLMRHQATLLELLPRYAVFFFLFFLQILRSFLLFYIYLYISISFSCFFFMNAGWS